MMVLLEMDASMMIKASHTSHLTHHVSHDTAHDVSSHTSHLNISRDTKACIMHHRALDYFGMTRRLVEELAVPAFAFGRPAYDNWLLRQVALPSKKCCWGGGKAGIV